ncbi:MAG: hypothetical protein RJA33_1043 [Actinomycetota bacterium]
MSGLDLQSLKLAKRYALPRALALLGLLSQLLLPVEVYAVSTLANPVCSAATCTVTFAYTGDFYTWTSPFSGPITFELWGAQGGNAGYDGVVLGAGGKGGEIEDRAAAKSDDPFALIPAVTLSQPEDLSNPEFCSAGRPV